jgi:uncharacterized protein YjaG (DUF416 family)
MIFKKLKKMVKEKIDKTYPRFIPNKPCGIDKFESKSQEKLTNAIANHIVFNDDENKTQNLSRIIGLEGGWGVGKSNVIKLLKNHISIKDNYFLFEYDAWGHQEDLQRRSFLEVLTTDLIKENILSGKTDINIKGGGTKKVSWDEKLKYLLARKTEISTEKRPKLSIGIIAVISVTIFTPIFASIAETFKEDCLILSIILPFIPFVIAAIIVLCISRRNNRKWGDFFNEIFSIYSGKIENEVSYETISEEEPTVTEFKKWMQDISDHSNKKIIIVYDNMDRLPAEKVKELWSSIHTFFSEDGFDNVWAIIPFDEKHLSCAFGEPDDEEKPAKFFISKTFPVVYRVTPPVITDFKGMFNTLFEEAFGNTQDQQKRINGIFRLENPNATIREMIEFINHLVALKNIWQDEIDILYMAVFVLKKDMILSNPVEQILSGNYLGEYIPKVLTDDELLQKNISALVYGVSLDSAEQIPMSKYLDSCFNQEENTDINRYGKSNNFIQILDDKIRNAESAQINNIVQCLSEFNADVLPDNSRKILSSVWETLALEKMKIPLEKQAFDDCFQVLLSHNKEIQSRIVAYLCKQIQSFKAFNSENYYNSLCEISEFLASNNIDIKITDILNNVEKKPEVFVDYVLCAEENYPAYKITVKPETLSKYLSDRVTDQHSVLKVLKYLVDDKKYNFDRVRTKIEEIIQNQQLLREGNFKPLFDAYKLLSAKKPLEVQLDANQRNTIWNALASKPNTPELTEILTIQIANGQNNGGTANNEQIKSIAENLDYYGIYGDLLINNLSWNIPTLSLALKYMTENKLGYMLSITKILPKFFEIKNNLGVSESILLEQFNRWDAYKISITASNIQQIIDNAQFFQFSKATKNALTDYLNATIIEVLTKVPTDTLYQQRQQPNDYWLIVIKNLIDTDFLKSLPDNLTDLGKRYLDDISAARLAIPNTDDIAYKIIEKLDRRKTVAHIKDIRDKYCNSQYNITPQLFLYFENWFEQQGDLKQSADRVTHRIIEPVINDTTCLDRIIAKSDYYAEIINAAGDDATALKDIMRNKIKNSTDTYLIAFAKNIGVEQDKQDTVS